MKPVKLFTIATLATALLFGCKPQAGEMAATETAAVEEQSRPEVPVRIMSLEKRSVSRTIDYNSTLEPWEEVYVAPASPGRIDEIYVEAGDRVKKGDKLFLMDQTQVHQTRIQLQSMETDLKRMETLLETGSITQQAYDQLKTQYDVTKSSLQFLSENTLRYAPFSGVITGRYYENGEIYSGAPNTQAGKASVVTLMQVSTLKAVLNVSESYYPMVKKGMPATVEADVFAGEKVSGRVILIYPVINPLSRSFQVEVEVPNGSERLKPGMFARVSLSLGDDEAFVIPANTVLQQEGTNLRYIFVEENGTARRLNVTLGKRFDDKVEIISDELTDGISVIYEGHTKLLDRDRVKVVE